MAIFNTVYGGEPKWKPGANTILYLPLEDDLLDHSNNQYTISNGGTAPTKASIGYQFGTNNGQYLKTASLSTPNYVTGNVWVNRTGRFSAPSPILLKNYSSSPRGYFNLIAKQTDASNTIDAEARTTNGSIKVTGPSITQSGWHNFGFTYDGNNLKLYIDGSLYGTTSSSGTLRQGNSEYIIGRHPSFGDQYFQGYVSKVIIENKVWTDAEFLSHYNNTKSNYGL